MLRSRCCCHEENFFHVVATQECGKSLTDFSPDFHGERRGESQAEIENISGMDDMKVV